MTNATRTLLIIFTSLILLTALVKWTSTPSSSEAFRSTIVDVDTARVNKILIEKPTANHAIQLKEEPSGWTVAGNDSETSYEADAGRIQSAVSDLAGMEVQAVVTRDPEKFTRYKVDSTGTRVSLYNSEELLASVIVGAPQFVSRREFNNYVRPANEETVYSVEGFLESTFNRDVDRWREKQVWDIDREEISRVDFLFPADSSYSIRRVSGQQWVSEGDTLKWSQVNTILNRTSSVRASGFADSLSASAFGTERYTVQLQLKDGTQRTIKLKPHGQDDTYFIATATDFPYVFTLNRSSWKNSVLKSREELLE